MHRQRHPIRPMAPRPPAQRPQRVLKPFTQTRETLRKTYRHVLPIRIRQNKVIHHVIETLTRDRHLQVVHRSEVRRSQPSRLMHLREKQFLRRTMEPAPLTHAPLQRPQKFVAVLTRIPILQPPKQRLRLQTRRPLQFRLHLRPHRRQRIRTRPPIPYRTLRSPLSGHLPLPIFRRRLPIQARFHRRTLQRRATSQLTTQLLNLPLRDLPHGKLLSSEFVHVLSASTQRD
jgi:hypothetical protein